MAKPICIFRVKHNSKAPSLLSLYSGLQAQMPDYYVFPVWADVTQVRDLEVEVFSEKDFTQVEHDAILKLIENALK